MLWKDRLRIRFTGPSRADEDHTLNTGDVAFVEKSRAQALIDAGLAAITDAEIGSPAPGTGA
jgi:hypothetical protein